MSIDMQKHIGEKHGRLTIIERLITDKKHPKYLCRCDCGNYAQVEYSDLTRKYGGTKSCGCYRKDKATKHNDSRTRLYRIYYAMINRVTNPNHKEYKYYGGKGITICDEWKMSYDKFKKWALNNGYSDELTIDRIDNQKGYFPKNCRWVTIQKQEDNKTVTKRITYNSETKTLNEWAKTLNIKRMTLYYRIYVHGWDIEKAFTTPVRVKINGKG